MFNRNNESENKLPPLSEIDETSHAASSHPDPRLLTLLTDTARISGSFLNAKELKNVLINKSYL